MMRLGVRLYSQQPCIFPAKAQEEVSWQDLLRNKEQMESEVLGCDRQAGSCRITPHLLGIRDLADLNSELNDGFVRVCALRMDMI